ncbi:MAG: glycosyltransferase family 4 protein, partial [Actinomycetota bacterium]
MAGEQQGMHVTMVCARFPPLIGGTEAHVYELGRRLIERGHRVDVVTTVADAARAGTSNEEGVEVHRVPTRFSRSDLHFAPTLRSTVERVGGDLIHVQGYHTFVAPMAMAAADRIGRPYVVTFHSGGHSSRFRRAVRPIQQRILRSQLERAGALIGVSAFESAFFTRRLGLADDRIETVPNGVAPEFVDVGRNAMRRRSGSPLVVSFGRLEEYKGHHKVIRAFARRHQALAGARLRLVGAGSQREVLATLAEDLGISDRVEFVAVPYGDRAGLAAELGAADVVVLMSSYESQGISGYEALATGARLIVADGSALTELGSFPGVEV